MTEPNHTPLIRPELVAPPSVSNLSVSQVGTGMFSVAMQVIMVVRFPADAPASEQIATNTNHTETPENAPTTSELTYGNGELANAFDGEAEGFEMFVQVHGYVPLTREILIQWATNSQGGA